MRMVRCFSIYYEDSQLPVDYIPFKNQLSQEHRHLAHRFEWNAMLEIMRKHIEGLDKEDFIGMFSWKFAQKTGVSRSRLFSVVDDRAEVWNCSPDLGHNIGGCGNFMDWSDKGHKGIKMMILACCEQVGIRYENNPKHVIYANQFLMRKRQWQDYFSNVIIPCLKLLEGEMWESVNQPSGYTRGLPKDELLQHTGLDFYNYVPFILERMAMQYVNHNKLSVKRV